RFPRQDLHSFPTRRSSDLEFVGVANYWTALTDELFWRDTANTVFIMVVTVAVELVIGFAFAMVMHRVIFARGVIRTSILIPYGRSEEHTSELQSRENLVCR